MAIILEGFDNSGKSTLAASFGLDVIHPGPRPKTFDEERIYLDAQETMCGQEFVLDRVTAISTPVYTGIKSPWDQRYIDRLNRMLSTMHCVLIYCRPPIEVILDFSKHEVKPHDTSEHIAEIQESSYQIIKRYDEFMDQFPHRKYDYTNPDRKLVQLAYDSQTSISRWKEWRLLAEQSKTD